MTELDPLEIAARVAAALETCKVRYVLGGSLASTAVGEPRATLDVDIVADLGPGDIDAWLGQLGPDFLADRRWIEEEVGRHGSFQLIHRPTMTRVDLFVPEWSGVHLWKWERRVRLTLDVATGVGIDVTAPEGIVIQKLCWFRSGGEVSDRQWRDVLGVIKTQGDRLDEDELRQWAVATGVADLLQRALSEAGAAG